MRALQTNAVNTRRSNCKLDPRTGIFLAITVSCIMISGGTNGLMMIVRPYLSVLPVLLLLLSRRIHTALRYAAVYCIAFAAKLFLIPETHGLLNFLLVSTAAWLVFLFNAIGGVQCSN